MAISRSDTSGVLAEVSPRLWQRAVGITLLALLSFITGIAVGSRVRNSAVTNASQLTDRVRGPGVSGEPESAETTEAVEDPLVFLVPAGRSPIPQSGEIFDGPVPSRPFARRVRPVAVPRLDRSIPWHEAGRHLGRTVTIKGTVVHTRNTGSVCFLNFAQDWQDKFYVVIFTEALGNWDGPPEHYFLNQKVLVSGTVSLYKGRPQVRITDPRQITLAVED